MKTKFKNKKFKVVSIHYTTECNMNCPFCYKKRSNKAEEKLFQFWYDLVPEVKKISNQIALGGGEPFMNLEFIEKFSKICKKNHVTLNITSNGRILMEMCDGELQMILKNIRMISLSYDEYKIRSFTDNLQYFSLVKRIKDLTHCEIGCNLLVTTKWMHNKRSKTLFVKLIDDLFKNGVDRIFALCPKNMENCVLENKDLYNALTLKYPKFFVDDLTKQILNENSYDNWKHECHYAKDIISINEKGYVTGCSFDCEDKALLKLKYPEDLRQIHKIKILKRYNCPYLMKGGPNKNVKPKLQ